MTIEFPAPEEARTFKDYVSLFRCRNPGIDFKEASAIWASCTEARGGAHTLKSYFDWCWQQPEAEAIHAAYTLQ